MTKQEFKDRVSYIVEVEWADGGRSRKPIRGSRLEGFLKKLEETGNYISDIDYNSYQADEEVAQILKAANAIWDDGTAQKMGLTCLGEAVEWFLKDSTQEAPETEKHAEMSREDFDRLVRVIGDYDFFPQYIESYKQQVEAERRNKKCLEEYCEILSKYGIEDYGISPDDFNVANLNKALKRWLAKRGVKVELAKKEAEEKAPARRVWTEEEIRVLVQTNDKVLYGALRKMYDQQTADEQEAGETTHRNGVGFNGVDAKIMTSFAEFLNRTGFLTQKQKMLARKKLAKYNKQLTRLANA